MSYLSFYYCYYVLFLRSIVYILLQKYSLIFSYSFIILAFIFRSVISHKFFFFSVWCEVGVKFLLLFSNGYPVSPEPLAETRTLSPTNSARCRCENQLTADMCLFLNSQFWCVWCSPHTLLFKLSWLLLLYIDPWNQVDQFLIFYLLYQDFLVVLCLLHVIELNYSIF